MTDEELSKICKYMLDEEFLGQEEGREEVLDLIETHELHNQLTIELWPLLYFWAQCHPNAVQLYTGGGETGMPKYPADHLAAWLCWKIQSMPYI